MKLRKRILIVAILTTLVLMLAGCTGGKGAIEPPAGAPNGATMAEITGTCTVEVEGNIVTVSIDANIMDGATVALTVNAQDSDTLGEKIIIKNGDNLSAEFAIGPEWSDNVYGFVVMSVDAYGKQPDHIIGAYGENFELIKTENFMFTKDAYILVIQSEKTPIK